MMKFILSILFIILGTFIQAQERRTFGYDGILMNGNNLIPNSVVKLQVSIVAGSENGTIIYAEAAKNTN